MRGKRQSGPTYDDARGCWTGRIDIGVDQSGKRRQKRVSAATKREWHEKAARLRVEVADGSYVERSRQCLDQFLEEWLNTTSVAPGTRAIYRRNLLRHVVPRIGRLRLQTIAPGTLNQLYADLAAAGLGPSTIRNQIHAPLGRALKDAVRWGRLARNPAEHANAPKARAMKEARPEMTTWTAAELEQFLAAEAATRYGPIWTFLATTGCRRGECLGLRWVDLDLDRRPPSATIRQNLTSIEHVAHLAPTTKSGRARRIDLDQRTVATLRTWRATQAQERLLVGTGYHDSGLVFTLPDGRPYNPEYVAREFTRRLQRHGLPRIRCHDLRHTWATLALGAGVDVKIVSERLGHASSLITRDIYQHVSPAMASDAAEKVAGIIFGEPS
jgi:integrase